MKTILVPVILFAATIVIGTSCKRQVAESMRINLNAPRKVQFTLYTDKDFSDNNEVITFKLSIGKWPDQILWDSVFSPMRLKDIPGVANKLIIEKLVPNNDPSLLKAGFFYSIENIGTSWHLDSFEAGKTFKTIDFNFQ